MRCESLRNLTERFHPWCWYALAAFVVLLDQVTKQLADGGALTYNTPVEITGFFNITLRYNTGAAFSMFADAGGWQRYMLGGIAAAVSVGLVYWIAKIQPKKWVEVLGLSLVLGGAIGNLYDRVVLGHVVDFIEFHWKDAYYFPAFNIADMAISAGAACLLFDAFFLQKKSQSTESEKT